MQGVPQKNEGLEVREFEDAFMVYQAERDRVHYLNSTAVLVLELCTGENPPAKIAELIQQTFGLEALPLGEVNQVLQNMSDEGLIAWSSLPAE
jgi:hypothetical protein